MLIIETLPLLRQQILRLRMEGKRVALVPTMGNLHDGHMKLVDEAKARADVVVVSIFVNPMQFDRPEDLARYPRTLQEDCEKLNKRKVDLVFAPSVKEIYPNGTETHTYVDVPGLSTMLEGASRPGHFRGVSTIVSKLFNLVQPDIACFGEKDFQQLALIRKMVADMGFDIEIVGVPIMRAKDGLALSSRNGYLTAEQRKIAPGLYKVLSSIADKLQAGEREICHLSNVFPRHSFTQKTLGEFLTYFLSSLLNPLLNPFLFKPLRQRHHRLPSRFPVSQHTVKQIRLFSMTALQHIVLHGN